MQRIWAATNLQKCFLNDQNNNTIIEFLWRKGLSVSLKVKAMLCYVMLSINDVLNSQHVPSTHLALLTWLHYSVHFTSHNGTVSQCDFYPVLQMAGVHSSHWTVNSMIEHDVSITAEARYNFDLESFFVN